MRTTISGTSGVTFPDSTSMQTGQQACKAWVNFNGTGTMAIRAGYNVSSITDEGTAVYTLNFQTSFPDAGYAIIGSAGLGSMNGTQYVVEIDSGAAPTTTSVRVNVGTSATTSHSDPNFVCIAIFR